MMDDEIAQICPEKGVLMSDYNNPVIYSYTNVS